MVVSEKMVIYNEGHKQRHTQGYYNRLHCDLDQMV